MKLACLLKRHERAAREVRNQGFAFSQCRHCRRDLVRSGRRWRTVPRGFRIVWRRPGGRPAASNAAQLLLNLPSPHRALTLLAPPRRLDRSRVLARLAVAFVRLLGWRLGEWLRRPLARQRSSGPVLRLTAG